MSKVHRRRVTDIGQVTLPAEVRRRWATTVVAIEDYGEHIVIRPVRDDPITAARGALRGTPLRTDKLRVRAREDEFAASQRRI